MKHRTSQAVFDYWDALRGERAAPLRAELDPAAIPAHLPDLFICEDRGGGMVRFRLAGTRLCLLFAREVGSRDFGDLFDDDSRAWAEKVARTALSTRLPATMELAGQTARGTTVTLEMVLLPMMSNGGTCDRLFGSVVALDRPTASDDWIDRLDILSVDVHGPEIRALIARNRLHEGRDGAAAERLAQERAPAPSFLDRLRSLRLFARDGRP